MRLKNKFGDVVFFSNPPASVFPIIPVNTGFSVGKGKREKGKIQGKSQNSKE
jgi:hypothetical protein